MGTWAERRDQYKREQRDINRRNAINDILAKSYEPGAIENIPYVDEQAQFMGVEPTQGLVAEQRQGPGGVNMKNALAEMFKGGYGQEALDLSMGMEKMKQGMTSHMPLPYSVQETQWYMDQPEEVRGIHERLKRAPTVMNLGGRMAIRAPDGGISESYDVGLKPGETPYVRGKQAEAAERGKASIDLETDITKKAVKAEAVSDLLSQAESVIDKATGSLVGTGVAAAKGAVGISDESTQTNQDLKLISGWLVSNVPRMEGPQSDFDVKNYREMAAQIGDSTIPVPDRRAAIRRLKTLQQKYIKQNQKPIAPSMPGPAASSANAPETTKAQAPQSAIDFLMRNDSPSMRQQFKVKYGYLPEGM